MRTLIYMAVLMASITWTPQPRQAIALARGEREILYGGARYGGKSDAGRAWMIAPRYITNPRYQGLVVRKNSIDLAEWIEQARRMYIPTRATFSGNPPVIKFPSGATIWLGHLNDANAYEKYLGWELQKILFEELTQIPFESSYEKLISSCRSTVPGLIPQVFCTTNPGGPGHVWVRSRFVDVACNEPLIINPDAPKHMQFSRIFIPATMDDNPIGVNADPAYAASIDAIKDVKLRNAWRYGDWTAFSGQFFDMWDDNVHIINPFPIPSSWARYRGLDWGYKAQAAVVWTAVDFDGNHYLYREYYKAGKVPGDMAQSVLGMSPQNENVITTFADPSIWAKDQYGRGPYDEQATTKSIYDHLTEEGLYVTKANNDRVSGWNNMRELLSCDANRKPKLFVFRDCKETIRTLPALVHDDHNVEDVNTDGEDHIADALRYVLMHTTSAHRVEPEKTQIELLIDKLHANTGTEKGWCNV